MPEPSSFDIWQLENASTIGHLPEFQVASIAWLKSAGALRERCSAPLACAAHDCPVPCEACIAEGEVEVVCTACRHVFPAAPVCVQDRSCASEAEFIRTRHIAFFSEARTSISKKGATPGEAGAAAPKASQGDLSADAVRNVAKGLGRALTSVGLRIRAKQIADRRRREERRIAERKRAEERKRTEEERRRADAAAAARAAAKERQSQTTTTLIIVAVLLVAAGYWISSRSIGNRSEPLPVGTMAEIPVETQTEAKPVFAPEKPASVDDRIAASEPSPASDAPWNNESEPPLGGDPEPSYPAETDTSETGPSMSPDGAVTEADGPPDGLVPPERIPALPRSSGWLGVALSNLDEAAAQARGLPGAMGALVDDVVSGGPAEAAGLRRGDVLLVINGEFIDAVPDVYRELRQLQPGMTIEFRVMRDRKDMRASITLGRTPVP